MNDLDLTALFPDGVVTSLHPKENGEERSFRLRIAEKDANSQRLRDTAYFFVMLIGNVILFFVSLYLAVATSDPIQKEWATRTLILLIGGNGGFLIGKATKKP